ncbi:MAG: hypothetical protein JW783_10675 [Bacteroidales bacterium]|nr:hypothetical protein [Bacteroidales bacterium]MBN2749116.1 hypothetical protein [Bacteroidales bacterium]
MGIKFKILSGFVILASLLFISGALSMYELTKLGRSVNTLLKDNYKSIDYSKKMMQAVSEQEELLLLSLVKPIDSLSASFNNADSIFLNNLELASQNLTLPNEGVYVDSIRIAYGEYILVARGFLMGEGRDPHKLLLNVRSGMKHVSFRVEALLTLNQDSLFKVATFLENSPHRAIMPGLIVIISSLVFTILLNYFINHYIISPILRLTKGVNDYVRFRKPLDVSLETKDELYSLKESIVNLITSRTNTK